MTTDQELLDKQEFLQQIYKAFGDFDLWYIKDYVVDAKKAIPGWSHWKKYTECTEADLLEANLRSVLKEEIILDIEDPQNFAPILGQLDRMAIAYMAFDTGSRGYHISMIFPELTEKPNNEVTLIKDQIIKHFGCDISKKSERNLIALEYMPHFKTGRLKKLYTFRSGNNIPLDLFLAMTVKLKMLRLSDAKFSDVFGGKWQLWGYPSRSEAEQYICTILAMNNFSPLEMRSVMMLCDIGKWQEKSETYHNMTMNKAIDYAQQLKSEKVAETIIYEDDPFKFFEEYGVPDPVTWLLPDYIPSKGVTIIAGAPGCGKSFFTEEMIVAIANDRRLFHALEMRGNQKVLLIDMENDFSTLYERIKKLGGVPKETLKIFNFDQSFDLLQDPSVVLLKDQVEKLDPCIVVFDTLRRVYSGDENDSRIINDVYKKVIHSISRNRCVLVLAHTRKLGNQKFVTDELSEIRGTGDIAGLASSVLMLKKNDDKSITVKPVKLRPAQLASPFTIKIEGDGADWKVKYDGVVEGVVDEIQQANDMLFDWLQHNRKPMDQVRTSEMVTAMIDKGYKRRYAQDAISSLTRRDILVRVRKGLYQYVYGNDSLIRFG